MKKTLVIFFALLLFAGTAGAQIFQSPYKKAVGRAEKKNADLLKGGYDFVIDPIEQVPTKTSRATVANQTNWGLS